MVKACDSQECPRKATGFCLVIPLERHTASFALGILSELLIWCLGDGFAQRCALHLEIISISIGLFSLMFWV